MHISILAIDEQSNLSRVACMAGAFEIFTEAAKFWASKEEKLKFKIELVSPKENHDDFRCSMKCCFTIESMFISNT